MAAAPALVLIDLQKAIDDPSWGARNNPHAEKRIQRLLFVWRQMGWPLFHIRHDSREPNSTYRPGQPLHDFKPETAPLPGENVLAKNTCSAFASTDLADRLRSLGVPGVLVCGVITNNSVEATIRAGSDLGFRMFLVEDACFTFGKGRFCAQDVHDMSIANLTGEYATIVTSTRMVISFLDNFFRDPATAPCLRLAAAAQAGNSGETAILACLLRDLPRRHGKDAVRSLGFRENVAAMVEMREATLRYLAAYGGKDLNPEEWAYVQERGGPMAPVEAETFGNSTVSFSLMRLRYFEEKAAQLQVPVPDFSHYRPLIESHLNATPSQQM